MDELINRQEHLSKGFANRRPKAMSWIDAVTPPERKQKRKLLGQIETDFDMFKTMFSTIDAPISDVMLLRKQLSKLKHENRLKQDQLDKLKPTNENNYKFAGLETSMQLEDSVIKREDDLKSNKRDIIEVEADHDTLLFMLDEAKLNQLAQVKKINELKAEHYRLTLNTEEVKQNRAEANEFHAQIKLQTFEAEKQIGTKMGNHELSLMQKNEELRILKAEVTQATDRLANQYIQSQKNEENAKRFVDLISMELESNDQQKKDIKRDKKLLSRLKKSYKSLRNLYNSSTICETPFPLPSQLSEKAVSLIIQRYKEMLYKESHLQILYVDLSNQENAMKEEQDNFKEILKRMTQTYSQENVKQSELVERLNKYARVQCANSYNTITDTLEKISKAPKFEVSYEFTATFYQHLIDLIRKILQILLHVKDTDENSFSGILGTFQNTQQKFNEIQHGFVAKHNSALVIKRDDSPLAKKRAEKIQQTRYTAYTHDQLVELYLLHYKRKSAQAPIFATKVQQIPVLVHFLKPDDIKQYLSKSGMKDPIENISELLVPAFRNQQEVFGSMIQIFEALIKRIMTTSATMEAEKKNQHLNSDQAQFMQAQLDFARTGSRRRVNTVEADMMYRQNNMSNRRRRRFSIIDSLQAVTFSATTNQTPLRQATFDATSTRDQLSGEYESLLSGLVQQKAMQKLTSARNEIQSAQRRNRMINPNIWKQIRNEGREEKEERDALLETRQDLKEQVSRIVPSTTRLSRSRNESRKFAINRRASSTQNIATMKQQAILKEVNQRAADLKKIKNMNREARGGVIQKSSSLQTMSRIGKNKL